MYNNSLLWFWKFQYWWKNINMFVGKWRIGTYYFVFHDSKYKFLVYTNLKTTLKLLNNYLY